VRDQARAVVQQSEEAGLDDFAGGQFEGGAEHHVGHPQLVGQGALEGFSGAAGSGRQVLDGVSVQLMAANNRYTEGRLKVPAWSVPFSTSWRTTTLIVSWGYCRRSSRRA